MKSIKPGRGPSAMNGIGSMAAAVFGIIWTLVTVSMGAPWFFALFGLVFTGMAAVQAAYHWKNAASGERFSEYDIVDSSEEGDPAERFIRRERPGDGESGTDGESRERRLRENGLEELDAGEAGTRNRAEADEVNFCPYCGTPVKAGYQFCTKCGRPLP